MPIYEYLCMACGHEFEAIRRVSAQAPECPKCGAQVEKKISLSAFHLKGGGWYSDAYSGTSNKGGGDSSSSEGGSSSDRSGSSEGGGSSSSSSSSESSSSGSSSKSSSSSD